jgi:CrcB protein
LFNYTLLVSVGVGGAVGAIFRFLLSNYLNKMLGASFAYGTLGVNIVGSLLIGFLFLYFEQVVSPNFKALLITGMLGALTTFSTFSLETVVMIEQGFYIKALLNILLNVTFSIFGTILGMFVFKSLFSGI